MNWPPGGDDMNRPPGGDAVTHLETSSSDPTALSAFSAGCSAACGGGDGGGVGRGTGGRSWASVTSVSVTGTVRLRSILFSRLRKRRARGISSVSGSVEDGGSVPLGATAACATPSTKSGQETSAAVVLSVREAGGCVPLDMTPLLGTETSPALHSIRETGGSNVTAACATPLGTGTSFAVLLSGCETRSLGADNDPGGDSVIDTDRLAPLPDAD